MPRQSARSSTPALASANAGASSIKVVSDLTAIPMGTLRAWERRYGFPKPARRQDSNRRAYSAQQVERLKDIARALEHGYRPADVIHMARPQLRALLSTEQEPSSELTRTVIAGIPTLLQLLARDDVKELENQLRFAAAALGAKRFVTECAQPLALAVGQAWTEGKLSIRHEHLLTECLSTQLRALLFAQQDSEGEPTILLSTLPGEPHTLGLAMVAVYVSVSAAKPRLLGAGTPADQIVSAAHGLAAAVVGIAVTPTQSLSETRQELQVLARKLPKGVKLWVGGSGVSALGALPKRAEALLSWSAIDAALVRARAR